MPDDLTGDILRLFADLLDYPTPAIAEQAGECARLLGESQPDGAILLDDFIRSLDQRLPQQIEELYTAVFDLQPVCYPYVGYHLFGESYKRGAFMARLNEQYHQHGYSSGKELPDHAPVILRFLALAPERRQDDFGRALLYEGLAPALEKMQAAMRDQAGNPYMAVVSALSLFLNHEKKKELWYA